MHNASLNKTSFSSKIFAVVDLSSRLGINIRPYLSGAKFKDSKSRIQLKALVGKRLMSATDVVELRTLARLFDELTGLKTECVYGPPSRNEKCLQREYFARSKANCASENLLQKE